MLTVLLIAITIHNVQLYIHIHLKIESFKHRVGLICQCKDSIFAYVKDEVLKSSITSHSWPFVLE